MPPYKLPGTLERSPKKAQRTYLKALESAEEEYGDGERAHRTAFAAVKHSFEKVGDHWEAKKKKGPSDPQAAKDSRSGSRRGTRETAGGVDVNGHTRDELYERAKKLGVKGRSTMNKMQLAQAISRKQD